MRLIGVKLSNLRNQCDVKRDKHLTEFFKSNLSREDYQKQNQQVLNQFTKVSKNVGKTNPVMAP